MMGGIGCNRRRRVSRGYTSDYRCRQKIGKLMHVFIALLYQKCCTNPFFTIPTLTPGHVKDCLYVMLCAQHV